MLRTKARSRACGEKIIRQDVFFFLWPILSRIFNSRKDTRFRLEFLAAFKLYPWLRTQEKKQFNNTSSMDPFLQDMTILEEMNLRDMIEAARDGRINKVKLCLKDDNVDANGKVFALDSAIHEACYSGHRDVVELLLDHGADIEARTYLYERLPLDAACIKERLSTVKLLLERGANANTWGSLYKACMINHVYMLNLLLDHGADINNNCNQRKSTPLHIACYGNSPECVRELLHRGANLTMQNIYGETAQDVARHMKHKFVFELINAYRKQNPERY